MKLTIINFSGNVGKSVVAHHLLQPRIPGAVVISVESINSNEEGTADAQMKGREFGEMQETLLIEDAAIVDVGASNVEEFAARMMQFRGSHETFDRFIVPVVPRPKAIQDTINTVKFLAQLGIPREKIRVIGNMVPVADEASTLFADLAIVADQAVIDFSAVIHESELFSRLREIEGGIPGLLADTSDMKAAIAAETDRVRKLAIARRHASRQLAIGVAEELDAVFQLVAR